METRGLYIQSLQQRLEGSMCKAALFALIVLVAGCGGGGGGNTGGVPAVSTESSMHQSAVDLYNSKSYAGAIVKFEQEITDFPSGALTDNALYYLAKAQYWLADYPSAVTNFNKVISDFPSSDVLEAVYYWKGKAQQKNGLFTDARLTYQFILDEYTATRFSAQYAGDAAYAIATSYYDTGAYTTAITEFSMAISLMAGISSTDTKLDNAQYYLAKSYHQNMQYVEAKAEYELLIATYPSSSWVGNAKIQIGVILIDQLNYSVAEVYFINLMADAAFAASADAAFGQYTLAGIYYDQANMEMAVAVPNPQVYLPLLASARTEFQKVISNYPLSVWVDNAQYQIGKTYYDTADYTNATTAFNAVLTNYPLSNSADGAQYYLGRTLQQQADAAKLAADTLATNTMTTVDYTQFYALLAQARSALNTLLVNYVGSSFSDNGQYQIGKTYYAEGNYSVAKVEFDKVIASYASSTLADNAQYYIGRSLHRQATTTLQRDSARAAYQLVLTVYPQSNKADGAQYYIARSYHDDGNCLAEKTAMITLLSNYPQSIYVTTAQTHLTDLNLVSPLSHTCL